jgi:N-acetylglucosaminyldiphosphoundecaprenol N-acetyl-beta-D-mannosaminyltransferase
MKKIAENNSEMSQKYVNILGINVVSTTVTRLLLAVRDKMSHNKVFYITTPNPELVLASTRNPLLKSALNSSDFSIPDGVGLNYAAKFLYGKEVNIIHGRILFIKLIELANKKAWKVFFLGGTGEEASIAAEKLKINYKKVKIETFAGPILNEKAIPVTEINRKLEKDAVDRINKFAPDLLFVAMKNPKQEIWIYKNIKRLNVGGAMAVGGTFRYIAGMSKLPPEWMENLGLEWLWRLIHEPKRIGRIFNAVVIFPLKVFWFKLASQ